MNCRSCGGATVSLCNLGDQPLANHLLSRVDEPYRRYPLEVLFCETCHLGQLRDLVPQDAMFREYVYFTSVSGPSVDSAKALVDSITVPSQGLVVEIGSNDGYLLQFYQRRGIRVLGIDPATGPVDAAAAIDITTVRDYFTADLAQALPQADVIHANNVLAHVPDLNDFVAGLAILLAPGGKCYVEVPYLGRLLEGCYFDTIYHEHAYYFSIHALVMLFERHALFVASVEHIPAHGGSLRLCISKQRVTLDLPAESLPGRDMQSRMENIAAELRRTTILLRNENERVWGFGAAAKATVMLNYCGISEPFIAAIADDTPAKIGKFIPGTGIEIRPTADWLDAAPPYTCVFAWNFAQAIAHRYATRYHGEMFTPYILPTVKEQLA